MDDVRSDEIVPTTSKANAPKDFQLGVLFVHGIGTQRSRNTVVQWGDELLRIIDRATKGAVKSRVVRAWPGDGSAEKPAEAAVFLRSGEHEETWLLAEGWWADTFPAPTYRELVSWSVRAVPWAITLHIAHRYWERKPHASGREKFLAASVAVLQLLIALALAPLFIALLLLALVVGLLPIAQVRTAILSAQSVLSGTAGDCLAFVESPVRAALIRTRILESLEALAGRCDRTVIVAHSQGAAAVLDALGGIADSGMEQEMTVRRQPPKPPPIPDTLLTFGAGINQLVSLKVLSRGLPEKFGGNPAYIGVASMVTALVLFAWLFEELRTGRTTINAVLQTAGVLFVLFLFWSRYGLIIPLPFDLPAWLPFGTSPMTQWAIPPLLIAAGAWLTSRLLSWLWGIWVRAEQRAVLAHAPATDTPTAPFVAMGIVVSIVLVLALLLVRGDWRAVQQSLADPRTLLEVAPLFLGWGLMLGFLARWRMPAPVASDVGGE